MKIITLILMSLFLSSAFAGDYSDFYRHCVLKKQGKFNYQIEQVDSANRSLYTPSSLLDDTAHHAVAGVIRGSTRIYDEARNLISVLGRAEFIKGKKIRDWTISTLKQEIRKYRMNAFEKASLVNCAVFMLVDYRPTMSTKLGSILKIYEEGTGICTEMTAIAKDLGSAVGLKVRSVVSDEDHNWPEYRIEGRWYILDPTSNGFTFMESLKQ